MENTTMLLVIGFALLAVLFANLGGVRKPAEAPREVSKELQQQIKQFLADGKKIGAVRFLRKQTGFGLKEALDAVEKIERPV